VVLLLSAVVAIMIAAIALHWPYSERMLVPTLQDTFRANVTIPKFRRFYLPHPGCEAEIVTLLRPQSDKGAAPLATVQKLTITGRYLDLIFRPHHIAEIRLDGLNVLIPARAGEVSRQPQLGGDALPSEVSIGTVRADGAVLEFDKEDSKEPPLKFEIHQLGIGRIAAGEAMAYQVSMKIPEPPGELASKGTFGPLQAGPIGKLPLHGNVTLTGAKLDKYPGIGGTVSSEENFSGTLEQLQVSGEATVPDFHLKSAGHAIVVTSQFQVIVNELEGEARLQNVGGKIGQTAVRVQGEVAKNAKVGKTRNDTGFLDCAWPSRRFAVAVQPLRKTSDDRGCYVFRSYTGAEIRGGVPVEPGGEWAIRSA
jgi:uncharacterized protein involved in outer membrane biogenesis